MANKKKGGLINRLLMGSEKSEGYARASLPSNRWELFWDIFKGRFWKLVLINILILITFIPFIALFFFRSNFIGNYGAMFPFSQAFGIGYGAPSSTVGYAETIVLEANKLVFLFTPIALMIASIGLSGGAYVIRNMVWTEGIFVSNDYWRGIKQNIKQILLTCVLYSVIFYLSILSVSLADYLIVTDPSKRVFFILSKILSIGFLIFFTMVTFHMITMSVTYELKFIQLIKNSMMFTLGLLPNTVFFLLIGSIPFFLILLGGFFIVIGIILIGLLGFSFLLLVWTDFCQWSYDKFVNDKIPGAQKNRGIYEKVKESNSEALRKYREQIALMPRSTLNSRPIKPITDDELTIAELPTSFNRNDIFKLNESRQAIIDDNNHYIEEHKNDEKYKYNEADAKADREKEERQKRIEKAKKELSKRRTDE